MPRISKGARLEWRADKGAYYIRDGGRRRSTGTRDRREAQAVLARYIAECERPEHGPSTPDRMTVGTVLDLYGTEHAPTVRDPVRIGYAITALVPVLGALPVGSITGEVCRRYAKTRARSVATVRKELGVLQAAINYCHSEGYVTAAPKVKLPPKPPSRDRWLTRDEVARLLRAAWRNPKSRHLARFILTAVYTGSRSEAILQLRFMPNTQGGWIDTEKATMYRRAAGEAETRKRTPTIPLPRQLLAHMRRWERRGARYVVEIDGQRVAGVRSAWRTALSAAGIEHCTRHDLRHTAITWAMQNGVDKWAASGYFGVSLDMIERTYGHHHPDYLRSAVQAMETRAGKLAPGTDSTRLRGLKGPRTA